GQDSVNDDNQNLKYEVLDGRIESTYAVRTKAASRRTLYDSYIRAIRWASDRVKEEGVIAYVSNGGYIDGNTADGLRKSLVDEFDAIYCYNLRGNARTAGEQRQKEAGNVFGSGSRNTVAILILVKSGQSSGAAADCELHYRDIGDYLNREDKLRILNSQDLSTVEWWPITPNSDGDWINQRDERFAAFQALGSKEPHSNAIFAVHSLGLGTNRDAWVYNYSKERLKENVESTIKFYNGQVEGFADYCKTEGLTQPTVKDAERFIDRNSRSEEHTSELQSRENLVCRLLLE